MTQTTSNSQLHRFLKTLAGGNEREGVRTDRKYRMEVRGEQEGVREEAQEDEEKQVTADSDVAHVCTKERVKKYTRIHT